MWFLDRGGWRSRLLSLNSKITFSICSKLAIVERPAVFSVELLQGLGIAGAGCAVTGEAGVAALFPAGEAPLDYVEVTLPSFPCHTLWIAGLEADTSL